MIGEGALVLLAGLVGACFLHGLASSVDPRTRGWLAVPVGFALWVLAGVLVLSLRIPFSPSTVAILWVGSALLLLRLGSPVSRREVLHCLWPVLSLAVLAVVAAALNLSAMTNDSFYFIVQAESLLYADGLSAPSDLLLLRSFPIFVGLVQVGASVVGRDYLVSVPTVLAASGLTVMGIVIRQALASLDVPGRRATVIAAASLVMVVSSYFVVFQAFYIRGNLEAGLYLFIALAGVWLASRGGGDGWWPIGGLAVTAAMLLRVESPLFLLPVLAVIAADRRVPRAARLWSTLPFACTVLLWYGTVLLPGAEGNVLDERMILVAMVGAGALPVIVLVADLRVRFASRVADSFAHIVIGVLVVAAGLLTALRPAWMWQTFLNVASNAVVPGIGLWGLLWVFVLVGAVLGFVLAPLPRGGALQVAFVSHLLLTYVSGYFFKVPHKLGWASSANRLLSVALFVGVFLAVVQLGSLSSSRREPAA